MAKAKVDTQMNLIQQGFDQLDASIAADDPEVGALIDMYIDKMSVPMARRMGVDAGALKQLAHRIISGRAKQKFRQETEAQRSKMATTQSLGAAMRQADVQLEGLKVEKEAFNSALVKRYVGASLAAAGSFIGQGIASGLFSTEKKGLAEGVEELEMMSSYTKGQIEGLPSELGLQSGQVKKSIEELGAGYEPVVQGLGGDIQLDASMEPVDFTPDQGMQPRGQDTQMQSLGMESFGAPEWMQQTKQPAAGDVGQKWEEGQAPSYVREEPSLTALDQLRPLSDGDFQMGQRSRQARVHVMPRSLIGMRGGTHEDDMQSILEAIRGLA